MVQWDIRTKKALTEQCWSKTELLSVIQALVGSLDVSNRQHFRNLQSKNKEELLLILQQVQGVFFKEVDNSEIKEIL